MRNETDSIPDIFLCVLTPASRIHDHNTRFVSNLNYFRPRVSANLGKTSFKSVSMRKPGRTRQGVIMLKSPISLKLCKNVGYQELTYVTEFQVKILNSLGDPGSPCKNRLFARFMHN